MNSLALVSIPSLLFLNPLLPCPSCLAEIYL